MKAWILIFSLLTAGVASASSTQKRVVLENEIRNRIYNIIGKVDPMAIVQVDIKLKKVNSDLPAFGINAEVTPVEYDGDLGASSLESVSVRIISQTENVPDWIRKEIEKSATIGTVKLNISYEKAGGNLPDWKTDLAKVAHDTLEQGGEVFRYGFWSVFGALALGLPLIGGAVFMLSSRLEKSLARVIEEKVVPALAQGGGGGGREFNAQPKESGETSTSAAPMIAPAMGGKELAELPDRALQLLIADCYWTESDAYAHYLWTQMSQVQREKMLEADLVDPAYYSFIRQFAPANLNYHFDARYLTLGNEFKNMNQADLSQWLLKNPKACGRVTPLRWDSLPLALADRLTLTAARNEKISGADFSAPKTKSSARELPVRLEFKSLKLEDEEFIWKNPKKIPVGWRTSLPSLVWLALTNESHRHMVLADLDAKQLAEAWDAPAPALARLREVLPPRKAQLLDHHLQTTKPDRNSPVFRYLFDAGLSAPTEMPPQENTEERKSA